MRREGLYFIIFGTLLIMISAAFYGVGSHPLMRSWDGIIECFAISAVIMPSGVVLLVHGVKKYRPS